VALALRQPLLSLAAAVIWFGITLRLCILRLRNTSRTPQHIAEMSITSAMIPFLSVFWRLYGALRFGVIFW